MNPKNFLTVILIIFITVLSGLDSYSLESISGKVGLSQAYMVSQSPRYIYIDVLINDEWWIEVFDEKGILVDQYPVE